MRKVVEFVRNDAIKYITIEVGTKKSLWIREFSDDTAKPAEIERKCMVYVKFSNKSLNSYMNHLVEYVQFNDDVIEPSSCGPDGIQGK